MAVVQMERLTKMLGFLDDGRQVRRGKLVRCTLLTCMSGVKCDWAALFIGTNFIITL